MLTLYEIIGSSFGIKKAGGRYGLELETEVNNEGCYPEGILVFDGEDKNGKPKWKTPKFNAWKAVYDGSLRNFGVEFVLQQPLDLPEVIVAIKNFAKACKGVEFIKDAPATSVHVHVNVQDMTPLQIMNFITLYTQFENVLVEFSGREHRRSNLFALPIRCAEQSHSNILMMAKKAVQGSHQAFTWPENSVKYASLNLAPMTKFGSLEIRCHRGSTDPKELVTWLSIIDQMYEFAIAGNIDPKLIVEAWRDDQEVFFNEVFGKYAPVLMAIPDFDALIDRNDWYAASIAYVVKDWTTFGAEYVTEEEALKNAVEKHKIKVKALKSKKKEMDSIFGKKAEVILDDIEDVPVVKVKKLTATEILAELESVGPLGYAWPPATQAHPFPTEYIPDDQF